MSAAVVPTGVGIYSQISTQLVIIVLPRKYRLKEDGTEFTASSYLGLLAYTRTLVTAEQLKAKAQSVWSATGVLAALLATIAAANLNTIPSALADEEGLVATYIALNYLSFILHMSTIVLITIGWSGTEYSNSDHIFEYLQQFHFLGTLPASLFALGAILLIAAFAIPLHAETYPELAWALIACGCFALLFVLRVIAESQSLYWSLAEKDLESVAIRIQ
jgi:hypothetical protein